MIRKAIIVVLTLGAVAVWTAWVLPLPSVRLGNIEPCEVKAWVVRRGGWLPGDTLRIWIIQVEYHRKTWQEPLTEIKCYGRGPPIPRHGPFLGLEFARNVSEMESNIYNITTANIPLVHLFIFFAAYPTLVFIRGPLRRWRRRKRGLCIRCGYNLEGNVSGVCSECGDAR